MSGVERHEIISTESKELLEKIQNELPRSNQQGKDSLGNRMYGPSERLDAIVKDLLASLQLGHLGHTVWRISNGITIKKPIGTGFLIPIYILGSPRLEPGGLQQPGWYTSYMVETDLTPELDCIFVGSKK